MASASAGGRCHSNLLNTVSRLEIESSLKLLPRRAHHARLGAKSPALAVLAARNPAAKKRAGSGSEPALPVREDYCGDVALAIG
jgi:hypothetical protein